MSVISTLLNVIGLSRQIEAEDILQKLVWNRKQQTACWQLNMLTIMRG